jgi:hypothetical protein
VLCCPARQAERGLGQQRAAGSSDSRKEQACKEVHSAATATGHGSRVRTGSSAARASATGGLPAPERRGSALPAREQVDPQNAAGATGIRSRARRSSRAGR